MTNLIKATERDTLAKYSRTDAKARLTLSDLIVDLYESGLNHYDFRSPKSKQYSSTATPEQYEARRDSIAFGLGAKQYKLYTAPKAECKTWDEAKKMARKSVQQDVGTYIDRIANALFKIDNPTTDKSPTPPVSDIVKMREAINKALKIAEKDESPEYDVVALSTALNDAQNILAVRVTK